MHVKAFLLAWSASELEDGTSKVLRASTRATSTFEEFPTETVVNVVVVMEGLPEEGETTAELEVSARSPDGKNVAKRLKGKLTFKPWGPGVPLGVPVQAVSVLELPLSLREPQTYSVVLAVDGQRATCRFVAVRRFRAAADRPSEPPSP